MRYLCATAISTLSLACARSADEYKFVPDTSFTVGILRERMLLVGNLDTNGDFTQTNKYPFHGMLTLPEIVVILNRQASLEIKVYEYRSGVLIPGAFVKEGNFVPDVNAKMMLFKDYVYSPSALPIWNLPGKFVPVNQSGGK